MNKRLEKRVVLLVCGLFALGLVLAFALGAGHVGHCCHPSTCSVCHQIQTVRELLKQLALALAVLTALTCAGTRVNHAMGAIVWLPQSDSPVVLKVRMNN